MSGRNIVGLLIFAGSLTFGSPVLAQWPPLPNPYCGVPTFANDAIPARGFSTLMPTPAGPSPIIFMMTSAFVGQPDLFRFALAHECGHHMLGHIVFNATNPMAPWMTSIQEYQADCWAARALMAHGDQAGVWAAINDAIAGPSPNLPMRVPNIHQCAGI